MLTKHKNVRHRTVRRGFPVEEEVPLMPKRSCKVIRPEFVGCGKKNIPEDMPFLLIVITHGSPHRWVTLPCIFRREGGDSLPYVLPYGLSRDTAALILRQPCYCVIRLHNTERRRRSFFHKCPLNRDEGRESSVGIVVPHCLFGGTELDLAMIADHGNDVVWEVRDGRDEQAIPCGAIFQIGNLERVRVLNCGNEVAVNEPDLQDRAVELRHVHSEE